jgi:hypothetical protein
MVAVIQRLQTRSVCLTALGVLSVVVLILLTWSAPRPMSASLKIVAVTTLNDGALRVEWEAELSGRGRFVLFVESNHSRQELTEARYCGSSAELAFGNLFFDGSGTVSGTVVFRPDHTGAVTQVARGDDTFLLQMGDVARLGQWAGDGRVTDAYAGVYECSR